MIFNIPSKPKHFYDFSSTSSLKKRLQTPLNPSHPLGSPHDPWIHPAVP